MYGHPIIVNIIAVFLTIPALSKHLALTAKYELLEMKEDVVHSVTIKKALIKSI